MGSWVMTRQWHRPALFEIISAPMSFKQSHLSTTPSSQATELLRPKMRIILQLEHSRRSTHKYYRFKQAPPTIARDARGRQADRPS